MYVDEALNAASVLSFCTAVRSSNGVQLAKPVVPRQCELVHTKIECLGLYIRKCTDREADDVDRHAVRQMHDHRVGTYIDEDEVERRYAQGHIEGS